jgi:hypothetical protein
MRRKSQVQLIEDLLLMTTAYLCEAKEVRTSGVSIGVGLRLHHRMQIPMHN